MIIPQSHAQHHLNFYPDVAEDLTSIIFIFQSNFKSKSKYCPIPDSCAKQTS